MKKIIAMVFSIIMLLSFPLGVSANDMTWVSSNNVKLLEEQNQFTIEISINDATSYAGAEFGIQCPEGVTIKSVTYNKDVSKVGPSEARGLTWFSFFSGENKFSGDTTAVLTLEYRDKKNTSVVIDNISVYTIENKTISTKQATPRKVIHIDREGADNDVKPLDPPKDSTPGIGDSNGNNNGSGENQNNQDHSSNGGFTTVNNSSANDSASQNENENIASTNTDNEESQSDRNNDLISDESSQSSSDTQKENNNNILNLIIGALIVSIGANVVIGYFIIKNKKKKEN